LVPLALALAGLLGIASGVHITGPILLDNRTTSLPKGLYLRTPESLAAGAVIAVRQPEVARAYLAPLGFPESAPLLKRVAAVQGDEVCRSGARVTWPTGAAVAKARDRAGRALPLWSGCRVLAPGEIFLVGDGPDSFDGRYFGPIAADRILGVFRSVR
jgi:type IV secretory pathway protease TraF